MMSEKENRFISAICLVLMMKTHARVSFLGNPHLGILLVESNRRLSNEFGYFGMKLSQEREFVKDAFSYVTCISNSETFLDKLSAYINSLSEQEFMERQMEVLNGKIY